VNEAKRGVDAALAEAQGAGAGVGVGVGAGGEAAQQATNTKKA
jgi:hypothetical protein